MKILVTGATGLVGSHLCRRLIHDGHAVTILRRPTSDTTVLSGLDLQQVVGDITDAEQVRRAAAGHDAVVHAAAHLADWRGWRDRQARVNVGGTRNVIAACQAAGTERLVHVSSVAAVGIPPSQHVVADETFPFNLESSPLTYHISKRRAEEAVLQAAQHGLSAVVVNPSSIFGPFGRGYRGHQMIERVKQSRIVTYFPGGRNVVHVGDVVDGIVRALDHGRSGERYILGGENLLWRQISQTAAKRLGLNRRFVPVPRLATRLAAALSEPLARLTRKPPRFTYTIHYCAHRYLFYDSSKAKRELGYCARPFDAMLEEYLGRAH